MPVLDISKALQSVGIGGSGKNTPDDLWDSNGLSDDEVIRELRSVYDECTNPTQKKAVLELAMKAKKMLQPDNSVGNVSFQIIINDPGGPQGPNPILIPREVKLP